MPHVDTPGFGVSEEQLSLDQAQPKYVGTQEALAAHLDCDRKSIQRWMKREDCPGKTPDGYDVEAWREMVQKAGLGRKRTSKSEASLKCEKLALENERRRLINEKLRGEVLHQDEVCKVLTDMMAGFVLGLRQLPNELAQEVIGLTPGEANKRIRRGVDERLEQLALGEWAQKKTFWSRVYAELHALQESYNLGSGLRGT
jgi:hypothetical protein